MAEKQLEISGPNGLKMTATESFYKSSALKKNPGKTKGAILVCKVDKGKLITGQKVEIRLPDQKTIFDEIVRIELNREKISIATQGQKIGICLASTDPETIEPYLN